VLFFGFWPILGGEFQELVKANSILFGTNKDVADKRTSLVMGRMPHKCQFKGDMNMSTVINKGAGFVPKPETLYIDKIGRAHV
jgi:hypothetical protein